MMQGNSRHWRPNWFALVCEPLHDITTGLEVQARVEAMSSKAAIAAARKETSALPPLGRGACMSRFVASSFCLHTAAHQDSLTTSLLWC